MKKLVVLFSLFVWLGAGLSAQESQIYINVGQAQVKKSLLALTPILYVGTQSTNRQHIEIGQQLYNVISNDLTVSNLFTFVKPEAYLEDPNQKGLKPAPGLANGFNFSNWKPLGTDFLVRAAYQVIGNDLTMEAYVYHVPTAKLVLGRTYRSEIAGARNMAHTFSNDLLQALTGKRGMFLTKIVASRQEIKGQKVKEIFIMDWDGFNPQQITFHNYITLSPAWSTKGDKIAYTSYMTHVKEKIVNPDMMFYELGTKKRYLVSYRKGINSGAAFLPGDKEMLLTISKDGSPDIFKMTLDGRSMTQLTKGPNRSMNVEPAVSPDGKQIAFSSDRLGRPMVFVMNIDGSGVKRLTFAGKYNSTPAWSPDGKTIAFAALDSDHFDIFTMNANGTDLRRLTDARRVTGGAANNESPSWSPDGRHVLFTSDRTGKYQLYIVSPDGTNERRITNDNYNWDKPKWSPYLN